MSGARPTRIASRKIERFMFANSLLPSMDEPVERQSTHGCCACAAMNVERPPGKHSGARERFPDDF
jgi:hypothetical protein